MVTVPACDPLLQDLKKDMTLPETKSTEDLTRLLRETVCGILEFAPDLSATWKDTTVTITMHGYRFIDGCQVIARESPRCCSMHPCAACSLCGVLIAGTMDTVVSLERCSPDTSSKDITAVFTLLKSPDSHP